MTLYRPEAVEAAIALDADLIFFNEYFPKDQATAFEGRLADAGYLHQLVSMAVPERANRVLCAARLSITRDDRELAKFDYQMAANTLCVRLLEVPLRIIGLRVPSYPATANGRTTMAWDWMEATALHLAGEAAAIVGDLNVHDASPTNRGGDHFRRIKASGWQSAMPAGVPSYFPHRGEARALDHLLHTSMVAVTDAWFATSVGPYRLAGALDALSDHAAIVATLRS